MKNPVCNTMPKYSHVDEWLDDPNTTEKERPAKLWLEKFRAPAHKKDTAWLESRILQCKFQGRVYVVVGCSRLGDIWLAAMPAAPDTIPDGYDLRVSINDCSEWSMRMRDPSVFIDIDGPWRILNDFTVTGYHMPVIVDDCNHVLFAAHTSRGIYERIVEDHNARLQPFVSPWDEGELPSDAHLVDDPITDHRICDQEGWALFGVDSTGLMEIERDDEAQVFASDADAVEFVRRRAGRSPYHRQAIEIHDRSAADKALDKVEAAYPEAAEARKAAAEAEEAARQRRIRNSDGYKAALEGRD